MLKLGCTPAAWLIRLASSHFDMQESRLEPVRGEESSHLEDAVVIVALGELRCRGLVENERHIRMELQGRRGDGAGDRAFDGFGDGGGLGRAGGQQKDFAGFEDRADAHGDGAARAFFAGTEKLGVVVERLAAQDFEAHARGQAGGRFVEADVSVAANAEKLEVDAARGANALVILTDWDEFRRLDLDRLRSVMHSPIIIDGRNLFRPAQLEAAGFEYYSLGGGDVTPSSNGHRGPR